MLEHLEKAHEALGEVNKAVLGKHVDELVDVEAPGGVLTYQILEIIASK